MYAIYIKSTKTANVSAILIASIPTAIAIPVHLSPSNQAIHASIVQHTVKLVNQRQYVSVVRLVSMRSTTFVRKNVEMDVDLLCNVTMVIL